MTNKQNRTLGAFEKTFWLLDFIDSKDFAIAGEIEGHRPVSEWRKALNKVQLRHPNLSVRIVMDAYSRPVFKHASFLPIPLRVLEVDQDYRWEQEVEKELSTRFNTEKEALLRAVLIQRPHDTVLILTGHHSQSDGTSMTYLFRDILTAVSGKELDPMEAQESNDETLGLPEDKVSPSSQRTQPLVKVNKGFAPKISSHRLSKELTNNLLKRAREEYTTVHGALCAAVLIACRAMRKEWAKKKIELISPICSRRALQLDDNYGLNITTHPVYFEGDQEFSFWQLARFAKAGLAGTDTKEHVKNYINFFRDLTYNTTDLNKIIEVLKEAFNQEIMVTNLGLIKYRTDFGSLKLKTLYGPMVRSGKGMEQTIGAITSNGSLCLTNTSDTPIEGLLQEMENILTRACHSV
ncbi:condensation domain-containing protein [Muricauda brasiliensis]|uniref:condensation domain-containing protein n=1 Tax=Muricauda brasiliensis TaxID=2162892 RepID=UPI000D345BC9|nr:condensation domain-containing protein [Muricauda brasiliensis]